ncbi:recombination protein NinG [Comamonas sp. J-3]|uniref:recombination protein NinG n=1 Tax=Comamonas trifloxystrobinivorans TaxID=3350256 RepID=UPI003729A977
MTFKRTRCPHCKGRLEPGQRIHPDCIDGYAEAEEAKAQRKAQKQARMQARVERAETKRKKDAFKSISELTKEAQVEFNAYIRARDQHQPCICCGRPLGDGDVGGAFDCGHYRSRGSAPHLRFNENNAHAQRKQCNRWGAGRAVDYRIGLIARIGLEAVEALEADNTVHKWTKDELRAIKAKYRAKTKQLKENA